jgi:hypothetical protein
MKLYHNNLILYSIVFGCITSKKINEKIENKKSIKIKNKKINKSKSKNKKRSTWIYPRILFIYSSVVSCT